MNRQRQRQDLTLSDLATVFGCCGLFDMCSDADLVSLTMQGADPFLDWIGWTGTKDCVITKNFITFVRPDQSGGDCTDGWLSGPCETPHSIEWGTCDFTLQDFALLRRRGPVRDLTRNDVRYCANEPRWRLDGTEITDQREYDAAFIAEVILQDLRHMIIVGNNVTAGQFDGLENLVVNNYTNSAGRRCTSMDSIVIDWNSNGMAGGAGITWNGNAIAATWNFIDVLQAVFRRIRQRLMWAPMLAARMRGGLDIILLVPSYLTNCILDAFTCWSVCDGSANNPVLLGSYEARQFRNSLLGGRFGFGQITLDNTTIPIMEHDWSLLKSPHCGDVYLLVGAVGNVKLLYGQYNDLSTVTNAYPMTAKWASDGGRFLHWTVEDETCISERMEMQPRLLCWAPWAQARFQDLCCDVPGGAISPDPCELSFFPEMSMSVAECP